MRRSWPAGRSPAVAVLRRPARILALGGIGLLALAACGTVPAPGTAPAQGTGSGTSARALCANPDGASRLVLSRPAMPRASSAHHYLIAVRSTVTERARVHDLARTLCALPRESSGPINCPAAFVGDSIRLLFSTAQHAYPPIVVNRSGCQDVIGLGKVRTVARSPGFWPTFTRDSGGLPSSIFTPQRRQCGPIVLPGGKRDCPGTVRPGGIREQGGKATG
ncbi:MAG TPA: hypothetical protein VGI64_04515 [Streptosporangiaceae bacterium]